MFSKTKKYNEKRQFSTGSVRDKNLDKGRFDLLPFGAISDVAKHFQTGSKKYGANNWRKGQPLSVFLDSAFRHLCQYSDGIRTERHEVAAVWNILCLIETKKKIDRGELPKELDDLLPERKGEL